MVVDCRGEVACAPLRLLAHKPTAQIVNFQTETRHAHPIHRSIRLTSRFSVQDLGGNPLRNGKSCRLR
jgi:hypothetical protein